MDPNEKTVLPDGTELDPETIRQISDNKGDDEDG